MTGGGFASVLLYSICICMFSLMYLHLNKGYETIYPITFMTLASLALAPSSVPQVACI